MPERTEPPKAASGKRTLFPCPMCGCTVLVRLAQQRTYTWRNPKTQKEERTRVLRWKKLRPPREPVSGSEHDCARALARQALLARWIAGELLLMEGGGFLDLATAEMIEMGEEDRG